MCHERYTLGGADPTSEEYEAEFEYFCSEESPVFEALESGESSLTSEEAETFSTAEGAEFTIDPVGAPKPGQP